MSAIETNEELKNKFLEIFKNKGNIGPIAEKARRNFDIIKKNTHHTTERVYHFCIGHAFKNIDKDIFKLEYKENTDKYEAKNFTSLQKKNFTIADGLFSLVKNIRNINNHYVHTFDELKLENYNKEVINFIKEAFEFAFIQGYLKEKKITYYKLDTNPNHNKKLLNNLIDKFYPNKEHQKKQRELLANYSFKKAIKELLFITVENDFEYYLADDAPKSIFTIKKGVYPSSIAQLFILSLFLYKHEAGQLISRITGFKQSEDKKRYKRDIFTFFSKKMTSQDIDSEEKYLVRFRDIIQYLNKYPTVWNKYLEPETTLPIMTNALERHVIEAEVFRSFPKFKDTDKYKPFLKYAVNELFGKKSKLFQFNHEYSIAKENKAKFQYELLTSPKLKDANEKLEVLLKKVYLNNSEIKIKNDLENKIKEIEESEEDNPVNEKLNKRIQTEKLLPSYGRNQDRFMDMALRFLAETNYFGKCASFKLYQFYTTSEQTEHLSKLKNNTSKKEYDKLKYHQGKLVHFSTFENHLSQYPNWDTPFVIENNAIQIKITLLNNEVKLFSIQRKMLVYLLEHAFFIINEKSLENKGKELLSNYYLRSLKNDFENQKTKLAPNNVTPLQRQLFPKRFLYQYQAPNRGENYTANNYFDKLINDLEKQEKRYELLKEKAKNLKLEADFLKKNKGKQFKLRFIRKAWHLMYFKDIYNSQAQQHNHHKAFHITKDEYNDFCRYMFAFGEVENYKILLRTMLNAKLFFSNNQFKNLFDKAGSLEDLFTETKKLFLEWVNKQDNTPKPKENNYTTILSKPVVYVNVSHFVEYLQQKELIKKENDKLVFKALKNTPYLIQPYYYKEILEKEEYKKHDKLFNKLRDVKLEDALLYELAIFYLKVDKKIVNNVKENVANILNQDILFSIQNDLKEVYKLKIPFAKLESYVGLIIDKDKNKFLVKINDFLVAYKHSNSYGKIVRNNKKSELEELSNVFKLRKELKLENLNLLNTHFLSGAVNYNKVQIALERHFIIKHQIQIPIVELKKDNRISPKYIVNDRNEELLKIYTFNNARNIVAHFDVPEENYKNIIENMEAVFIEKEIKPQNPTSFNGIKGSFVCELFMDILHSYLYKRPNTKNMDDTEIMHAKISARKEFQDNYFKKIIKTRI